MKKFRPIISLVLAAVIALCPLGTARVYASELEEQIITEAISDNAAEITEGIIIVEEIAADNIAENEPAEESDSTPDTVGGNVDDIGGGYTEPFPDKNISDSYKDLSPEGLTIILRGVQDADAQETFDAINQYIGQILETGKYLNIKNPSFIDAEKYKAAGYDSNHCWAATSANILWTTGYAQKAINPMTGKSFASEDELLTYFTANFTDLPGCPEDGISWFFKGTSGYADLAGAEGVAQIKNGSTNTTGLLSSESPTAFLRKVTGGATDAISALLNVAADGMGVLVRWFDSSTKTGLTEGAHWATINGVVYDKNEADYTKKYRAIILADSDNTPVNGTTTSDTNAVLKAKIAQPNIYTVYKLTYDSEKKYWLINNYGSGPAVITHIYGLLDSDKTPQGSGDNQDASIDAISSPIDVVNTDNGITVEIQRAVQALNDSGIAAENGEEIYFVVENAPTQDAELLKLKSFTENDFDKLENIEALHTYLVKNLKPVFLMNDGIAAIDNDYVCFVNAANTYLYNLTIDGAAVPADAYRFVATKNGITKLVINKNYLAILSKGVHKVRISVQGSEIPTVFEITLM